MNQQDARGTQEHQGGEIDTWAEHWLSEGERFLVVPERAYTCLTILLPSAVIPTYLALLGYASISLSNGHARGEWIRTWVSRYRIGRERGISKSRLKEHYRLLKSVGAIRVVFENDRWYTDVRCPPHLADRLERHPDVRKGLADRFPPADAGVDVWGDEENG